MNNLNEYDLIAIFVVILVFVLVFIMAVIYLFFNKKKAELLFEKQKKEAQFEQELASAIIEMKETTLSYIGQELHDDLGQKMSVAKLMVNHGIEMAEGNQKKLLEDINEVIGESIRDIRSLSKSFITEQVENLGLIESLQKEIDRIDRLSLLRIDFQSNTDDLDIHPKDSVILFRIIQECINNVLKHSRAKNLEINVEESKNDIKIKLQDDGIGFEINNEQKGSGLLSMMKRAKLIGAQLDISSEIGKGTTITFNYKK